MCTRKDYKIRKYLHARLIKASVSKIIIERTLKNIIVTISTSRPGLIIGKGGQEVDKLKEELKKIKDYILIQKIPSTQILKFKNKYILACF